MIESGKKTGNLTKPHQLIIGVMLIVLVSLSVWLFMLNKRIENQKSDSDSKKDISKGIEILEKAYLELTSRVAAKLSTGDSGPDIKSKIEDLKGNLDKESKKKLLEDLASLLEKEIERLKKGPGDGGDELFPISELNLPSLVEGVGNDTDLLPPSSDKAPGSAKGNQNNSPVKITTSENRPVLTSVKQSSKDFVDQPKVFSENNASQPELEGGDSACKPKVSSENNDSQSELEGANSACKPEFESGNKASQSELEGANSACKPEFEGGDSACEPEFESGNKASRSELEGANSACEPELESGNKASRSELEGANSACKPELESGNLASQSELEGANSVCKPKVSSENNDSQSELEGTNSACKPEFESGNKASQSELEGANSGAVPTLSESNTGYKKVLGERN